MSPRIVTFGEIMLRLKSPGHERLLQSPVLEATFGGGEANVAASLARFGLDVAYVTVLPRNALGDACLQHLRGLGVDISMIARSGERLGTYYLEAGANQRPSKVIYDRTHSSIMDAPPETFDWPKILEGATWFHVTGITPALSASAAAATLAAVTTARQAGITVSCDYNFRRNLWKYGRTAPEVMTEIVGQVNVGIANEEDCQQALSITNPDSDWEAEVSAGQVHPEKYRGLCEKVLAAFPNLRLQAITLRQSGSADRNGWSACLHNRSTFMTGPNYVVDDIVDRVGTGDAFAAGLIYALTQGMDSQQALDLATAASCLKHSIAGDLNLSTVDEVLALMQGHSTGRIQR
ncbi:MAG: sugar kinase [Anaerolineales bacterium]|nr:sugar kinase [Anaerolineales bacterium]